MTTTTARNTGRNHLPPPTRRAGAKQSAVADKAAANPATASLLAAKPRLPPPDGVALPRQSRAVRLRAHPPKAWPAG